MRKLIINLRSGSPLEIRGESQIGYALSQLTLANNSMGFLLNLSPTCGVNSSEVNDYRVEPIVLFRIKEGTVKEQPLTFPPDSDLYGLADGKTVEFMYDMYNNGTCFVTKNMVLPERTISLPPIYFERIDD